MSTMKHGKNADPNVWGPPLWDLLFTLAYKLPASEEKESLFANIFRQLEYVLPCQHCRRSYIMYRKQVKVTKEYAQSPAEWLWVIHDMVNQNLGKTCINYEKLTEKHGVFTCLTHPLNVLDLFCVMHMVIKDEHLIDFVNTIVCASAECPGMVDLKRVFDEEGALRSDMDASIYLWNVHNRMRKKHGMQAADNYYSFWNTYEP